MVSGPLSAARPVAPAEPAEGSASPAETAAGSADIKSFVTQKAPKSDVHFAATVAYYHQFIAPAGQRKDSITKEDLVEACRQVPRKRPTRPPSAGECLSRWSSRSWRHRPLQTEFSRREPGGDGTAWDIRNGPECKAQDGERAKGSRPKEGHAKGPVGHVRPRSRARRGRRRGSPGCAPRSTRARTDKFETPKSERS
jgi:hypothetical protein